MSETFSDMGDKHVENQRLIESQQDEDDELSLVNVKRRLRVTPIIVIAIFSIGLNMALTFTLLFPRAPLPSSNYANLTWSQSGTWSNTSLYLDQHRKTKTDQAWESIDWHNGIIALDDEEAKQLGLPRSQRFPWDDSKGIYLLNAHHNLHCLKWLWKSLAKFRDGKKFEHDDWHGFHCLDSLRQDTICQADDTPRYTGEGQDDVTSGFHQSRQCRDWDKLEQWAKDRSSCYRFLAVEVDDSLDRYKFCPKGSPYNDVIADIYGPNEQERLINLYGDVAN